LSGPTTVVLGQTVTYTMTGSTAPGGYGQLVFEMPFGPMFQMTSASITGTTPSPSYTVGTIYANASGWQADPSQAAYDSQTGTNPIPGGNFGSNVTGTFTVKAVALGSTTLHGLIYDNSGG